ncbi:MAG: hypothetical protein KIT58_19880, partial [Planctomycetota bacterium]|nr:hypothetical protein [Planctomycetota bacterium]
MSEPRRTTARRATRRTKKVSEPAPEAVSVAPEPTPAPAPEPTAALEPAPAPQPREWVPIIYEGQGVFADRQAGVFVAGTRTRLRERVASRLLRIDGFRLA